MTKVTLRKSGVNLAGEATSAEVIDNFNPSNALEVSSNMAKVLDRSKKHDKSRKTDLATFTSQAVIIFAEMTSAKKVCSVASVKAIMFQVSGKDFEDPKALSSPAYKYLSETLLSGIRQAMLIHDKKGFRITKSGQFQVLKCVDKPMVPEEDSFGNKIAGTSVPNPNTTEYQDVPYASIAKHFGKQYVGSVEKRGTKKTTAINQQNPATKDQVLTDLAHKLLDTGLTSCTIVEVQLVLAVFNSGIKKADCYTTIEARKNGEPTAVAVNA